MSLDEALSSLRSGDVAHAGSIYRQIISKDPMNFTALHMLGIVCSEEKKLEDAEKYFNAALAVNPTSILCYLNFGAFYFRNKNYPAALEQIDKALDISPNYGPAHSDRGCALVELGRIEEAYASHNRAIELAPNDPRAWYNHAFISDLIGHTEAALGNYDNAIALDQNYADAWNGRGNVLIELKRYDEALASFDKAIALKPDLAEALNGRGNVLTRLARYDDAIVAYDSALALKPDLAESWLGRGNALARLDRFEEAFASYDKAQSIQPNLAEVWDSRGTVLTLLKRYDEAFAAYDRSLDIKPDSAKPWLGRGDIYLGLKRPEQALMAYDRALSIKPDYAEAWVGRGTCQRQKGQIEEAIKDYRKALQFGGDAVSIHYELAQLGAEAAPSATPKSLVKSIFNDYARTFDEHLVNKLKYQTPIKIFQLIESSTPARDIDVLDLGCGTGLMGVHLRQIAKTLTGVDLSENMLQEAKRRGIYDELHCNDISEFLGTHNRSYDLVVASDVFVYIGDLNPVFQLIKKSLKTNGLFCFSVEKSDADNFILRGTGRYAHSSKYIRDLAAALGFRVESIEAKIIRQESSRDVDGYISILRP